MDFEEKLSAFIKDKQEHLLANGNIGLEKECLRVDKQGKLSQKPHPISLGSALTNPYITTDYSEALLEFITPPLQSADEALSFMKNIHRFVYSNIGEESLWNSSMPCVVEGDDSIPIAQYGHSNLGTMKTVYRRGLGHRYGKMMQVIAGVHFNYSLQASFWPYYQRLLKQENSSLQDFISEQYFCLTRNLQRYGWLIYYLFGCSPAICKSFLQGQPNKLEKFDDKTFYLPYATSLRMGDIGYTNKKENDVGVKACYNNVDAYVNCLTHAIETPCEEYAKIGVKVDGEYRQLNANILQIENEYYSTVRPKQPLINNEKPVHALSQRGVEYIELRSLDLNLFEPLGISKAQLRFLEAFMLLCLFKDSPLIDNDERKAIDNNENKTAHQGRDPRLTLSCNQEERSIHSWGTELLQEMHPICEILDKQGNNSFARESYQNMLCEQFKVINDPNLTPSAKMLNEMRENNTVFFKLSSNYSKQHQEQLQNEKLTDDEINFFTQTVQESISKQKKIELEDNISFDDFLHEYFSHNNN